MKTSDFYYDLPKELIAQTPLEPRDSSRLLVLDREKQTLEHKHFYDIIDYLNEGDLLVANDSRVLPARIYGIKDETGAKVEFLLLKQVANNRWETLCKPGKKAKVGTKFSFGNGILRATVVDVKDDGNRIVDFDCEENFFTTLDKIGQMPLPPYITAELDMVLIMSVNPGFGGQKFIEYTIDKVKEVKEMSIKYNENLMIQVDGGIDSSNVQKVIDAGANVIVAGSAVFKNGAIEENIKALRGI